MKSNNRVEKSFKNILIGTSGQIISYVLSFLLRMVFIDTLGDVYLGLNGLYTNILSILNMAELGLGTAIVLELYRTTATNNKEKTKEYLTLYKKAYFLIGMLIFVIGLALTPILDIFVNDLEVIESTNYKLIFILYLANVSSSYLFFEYRQALLIANQVEYKGKVYVYVFKIIEIVLQILALFIFKNIYIYLIIPIVIGFLSNITRGVLVGKLYPYIKDKPNNKLTETEVKKTSRNVFSVALYKINDKVTNTTDSLILSSFISVILTGIYSNYLLIRASIRTILESIFYSFTASLGNLSVSEENNVEKKYRVFKTMWFLNFWMYGICTVCLYVLITPFISLWIGEEYLLNNFIVFLFVLNFLIIGLQETVTTHRAAYGLFYYGRLRPIFSITIKILLSIAFVIILPDQYGIVGVLLGTTISVIFTTFWFDTLIVYKHIFLKKPVKYYLIYFIRIIFVMVISVCTKSICNLIHINYFLDVLIYGLISVIIFNFFFFIIYRKNKEYKYSKDTIICLIKKKLHIKNAD